LSMEKSVPTYHLSLGSTRIGEGLQDTVKANVKIAITGPTLRDSAGGMTSTQGEQQVAASIWRRIYALVCRF
jgi:hypothetical protein